MSEKQAPTSVLASSLIQSLHINSHTVVHQEVNLRLENREELLAALELVLKHIGAENHYKSYLKTVKIE